MPPKPGIWAGRDETVNAWLVHVIGFGRAEYVDWKCRATTANSQPAMAIVLATSRSSTYQALTMDVLRIENGFIAQITTFDSAVFG